MNKVAKKTGPAQRLLQFAIIFKQQKENYCYWCGKKLHSCEECKGKGTMHTDACQSCKGTGVICSVHKTNWD
jgi:DnaJ-class molecular chaperone